MNIQDINYKNKYIKYKKKYLFLKDKLEGGGDAYNFLSNTYFYISPLNNKNLNFYFGNDSDRKIKYNKKEYKLTNKESFEYTIDGKYYIGYKFEFKYNNDKLNLFIKKSIYITKGNSNEKYHIAKFSMKIGEVLGFVKKIDISDQIQGKKNEFKFWFNGDYYNIDKLKKFSN